MPTDYPITLPAHPTEDEVRQAKAHARFLAWKAKYEAIASANPKETP